MKNSKKGISLIVLVITIIVIIIIAAAVILGLTKSNPINNSKIASMTNTRDSIYSTVNMYVSQMTAKTQGVFDAKDIMTGLQGMNKVGTNKGEAGYNTEDPILGAGVPSSLMVTVTGGAKYDENKKINYPKTTKCTVNGEEKSLYQIDRAKYDAIFPDAKLPSPATADSTWYIDPTNCKIYLIFTANGNYPQWMKDGEAIENNMATFTGYVSDAASTAGAPVTGYDSTVPDLIK